MRAARRSFPRLRTSTLPRSSRATRRGLRAKKARGSGVAPASCRLSSERPAPGAARKRAAGTAALRCTLRRLFQVCQHFPSVAFRLYLGKDVLDLAIWSDNKSGPDDAHDFLAVHVLFLEHAEGVGDFFVGVGEEREPQLEFLLKLLLRLGR